MSLSYELLRNVRLRVCGLVICSRVRSAREQMTNPRAYNLAYALSPLMNSLSLRLRAGQALVTDLSHCLVVGRNYYFTRHVGTLELNDACWPTTRLNKQGACKNQTLSDPKGAFRKALCKKSPDGASVQHCPHLRHLIPFKDNYAVIDL